MKTSRIYKTIDFPPLTEEQKQEIELLKKMSDSEIDYSDIKEHSAEDFAKGHSYYSKNSNTNKKDIHAKIDVTNFEWLEQNGKEHQTLINNVLHWARTHGCPVEQL